MAWCKDRATHDLSKNMMNTHLAPLAAPTSRIDPLLAELSGLAEPFGDAHHLGTLRLPAYAMDGRALQWNQDQTAVAFDATEGEYFSDGAWVPERC